MNVILNQTLINSEDFQVNLKNRAFQYGDGLFETIIYKNNNIQYLEDHLMRLFKGMQILQMIPPENFNFATISQSINTIIEANKIENEARIKLQVWRRNGGLYTPQTNDVDVLICCSEHTSHSPQIRRVSFCESISLSKNILSDLKTCNSLPYIMACLEKEKRQLDDLIILDLTGNISECTASNIFWKTGDTFYTPSLDSGCISGIMRKNIIIKLKTASHKVVECLATTKELLAADFVFSRNVAGLYPIHFINDREYKIMDLSFLME